MWETEGTEASVCNMVSTVVRPMYLLRMLFFAYVASFSIKNTAIYWTDNDGDGVVVPSDISP